MNTALRDLLRAAPGLDRVVEADHDGGVARLLGSLEGESVTAAVLLAENYLAEVGALLGLGGIAAWATCGDRAALYVVHGGDTFIAALGAPSKALGCVLERLISRCD